MRDCRHKEFKMENKVMGLCVLALGLLGFATSAFAATTNDISCGQALTFVLPCQGFLTGSGSTPSVGCCLGVQRVLNEATSTQIRRSLCECFKRAAGDLGVKADRSKSLGDLCHVSLPVPLDPNIDCSTVPN